MSMVEMIAVDLCRHHTIESVHGQYFDFATDKKKNSTLHAASLDGQ